MLSATGYALQGRPDEPGSPAEADTQRIEIDPGIVKLRGAMMGNFPAETPYLADSDATIRPGAPAAAAAVLLGGIRQMPKDMVLWTGRSDGRRGGKGCVSTCSSRRLRCHDKKSILTA